MPSLRQVGSWVLPVVFVGLVVVIFYRGGAIDITASALRVGYGAADRLNWDDKPFSIGHPDRYAEDGLYLDFVRSHGVYVVTTHGTVVALSAESPATGRITRYEHMSGQFADPHNGDRFTTNGVLTGVTRDVRRFLNDPEAVKAALDEGRKFSRSLERCYIKLRGRRTDPDAELIVDPRHRFLFELNQWSQRHCAYRLDKPED